MNTDLRKILRDAIQYEFENGFYNWISMSVDCLTRINNPKIKNSFDLRQALLNCEDFEIEQEQNYIAYKMEEDIKSSYMKLEEYTGCVPVIASSGGVLPNYEITLTSPSKITANSRQLVVVLGKFIDEYKLQAICDSNYWENEKCKAIKSREYVNGKEISKARAIDLGFKYIKVGD